MRLALVLFLAASLGGGGPQAARTSRYRNVLGGAVVSSRVGGGNPSAAAAESLVVPGETMALQPQTTDLSVRFNHLESRIDADALVAYWSFDEGSGYEFKDLSGNRRAAYITGTEWNTHDSGLTRSFHRQGRRAGCVYLNGTQWLEAQGDSRLKLANQVTVTAWIKPEANTSEMAGQSIVRTDDRAMSFDLQLGDRNNLRFLVADGNSSRQKLAQPVRIAGRPVKPRTRFE